MDLLWEIHIGNLHIFGEKIFNCLMQHFSGGLGTRLTFEMPLHRQPLVASYIYTGLASDATGFLLSVLQVVVS